MLSAERFSKLSEVYEKEQAELRQSTEELRGIVAAAETQTVNIKSFLKIVKKYTEPTELTPALLREFVEKVVVHAPDKSSGHRVQRIDVHYNFIGEIDLPRNLASIAKNNRMTLAYHTVAFPKKKTSLSGVSSGRAAFFFQQGLIVRQLSIGAGCPRKTPSACRRP